MVAAPHQRSSELSRSGDAHQDDGDDGQHDVDALPQQNAGVVALELDRLLLMLLLEFQLRHSRLTRLQSLLKGERKRVCGSGCLSNAFFLAYNTVYLHISCTNSQIGREL